MAITQAQKAVLAIDVRENTDQTVIDALAAGDVGSIVSFYNSDSTTWAWKNQLDLEEVAKTIDGDEWRSLSDAEVSRFDSFRNWRLELGAIPCRFDHRHFFDVVFTAQTNTLASIGDDGTLWKRLATFFEELFSVTQVPNPFGGNEPAGDGTNGAPNYLIVEGNTGVSEVASALSLPHGTLSVRTSDTAGTIAANDPPGTGGFAVSESILITWSGGSATATVTTVSPSTVEFTGASSTLPAQGSNVVFFKS